jgi:MFS family permease
MKRINRNIRVFLISDLFYYSSYDLLNVFLTILITTKVTDGRLDAVGLVLGYYMLLRALAEIPLAKLVGVLSTSTKINFVSYSHVVYGLVVGALGFSQSLMAIFFFVTVVAFIDASTYPIKWAIFSKLLDRGNEEIEWSLEDVLATTSTAVFAVLGGFLSERYGLEILFLLMGATFATCGFVFHFIHLDKHKRLIKL